MFLTIIVFIIILGVLVFVHEFGHFMMAKINKIGVEEFAFGFPPKLICKKIGETNYCINAIPLGGYVRLIGEEEKSNAKNSFTKKSFIGKASVIVAGVVMNFILAGFLLGFTFIKGTTPIVSDPSNLPGEKNTQVGIYEVEKGGVADLAGIASGDIFLDFKSVQELTEFTASNLGKQVNLSYKHYQEEKMATVVLPEKQAPLGVTVIDLTTVKMPFFKAIYHGFIEAGKIAQYMLIFLKDMFFELFHGKTDLAQNISGPVGIYKITGEAIKLGWSTVIKIAALLSVNLALINILPLPALDGGKLLFIGLERVFRKKVIREEVENIIHLVGFALLIFLMILITYRDIFR